MTMATFPLTGPQPGQCSRRNSPWQHPLSPDSPQLHEKGQGEGK